MARFSIPKNSRQEQFSIAYIRSIASVAGYAVDETRVDVDSVDCTIVQPGDSDEFPEIEGLRVQAKCTYAHRPKSGSIRFPLSIKNYNDLRRECMNPRILVIVHVPQQIGNWLRHWNDSMSLYHCAYWLSLRGQPPVPNSTNVTVTIPTSQVFTVDALVAMMDGLAEGIRP